MAPAQAPGTTRTPFGTEVPLRAGGTGLQARPWRPASFTEWVRYAPTAYLLCFDEGHQWQSDAWSGDNVEWLEDRRGRRTGELMLHRTCGRCGLPMLRWRGAEGQIDGRLNVYLYHQMTGPGSHHDFPYVIPGMARGRAERMMVRMELGRRLTEGRPVPPPPAGLPAYTG